MITFTRCTIILAAFCAICMSLPAQASLILLSNDFEVSSGVSAGSYTPNGSSFGAAATLGNALYSDRGLEVTGTKMSGNSSYSGAGVSGGSHYLDTGNAGISSRNSVTLGTQTYRFDFAFMPLAPSQNGMMVGGGLSASSTYKTPWSADDPNSIFVGLDRSLNLKLSGVSNNGTVIDGNSGLSLTNGEWHRLAFSLSFDGANTWTVSDLTLENLDSPTTIATVISWSHDISGESYGTGLSSASDVYGQVEGAYERGLDGLDNVEIMVVPEPVSISLMAMAGWVLLTRYRASRRA